MEPSQARYNEATKHERMGNFEEAMVALGKAVIHGDKTDDGELKERAVKLAADVLEVCTSCHAKFRD